MFNEILTGQSSIEPPKARPDPYRAPAELPPTLTCTTCGIQFPAGQAMSGKCRTCAPKAADVHALMQRDRISYMDAVEDERKKQLNRLLFRLAIGIVIAIGIMVFRYGMREQYREDMQKASGHRDNPYFSP